MTTDLIVSSMTTLISVFVGAWLAFTFQNCREKKEIKNQHIATANLALCTVYNLWNILIQIQEEVIDPCREKADAWFNMPASPNQSSSYALTSFQANELAFLLQTKQLNTFSNLLLEEQRFVMAMQLIEERSSIILNHVFPKLGAAGVPVGGKITEPEIEKTIGIDTVHKLKHLTSAIIKNVDEDLDSLKMAHDELRNTKKKLYPNEKFILIEFKKTKKKET